MTPILILLAYGFASLSLATDAKDEGGFRVVLVQADIPSSAIWHPDFYGRNLETYLGLTLQALRVEAPALTIWPESAMTFFVEQEPAHRQAIARVLGSTGTQLLSGGVRLEGPKESPRYYNSVFAISPDGSVLGHYDKEKLVPFGEYFPFHSIAFLRRRFEQARVFHPGSGTALLPSAVGPVAVATCNEIMLPELVARRVALGGQILLNPSNDSWSPEPVFAEQMLDMAVVRAIENRRWLLRASTTGPSAIVDPWGRIAVSTKLGERRWISGTVHPETHRTLYNRVGDSFAIACVAVTIGALFSGRRTRAGGSPQRR